MAWHCIGTKAVMLRRSNIVWYFWMSRFRKEIDFWGIHVGIKGSSTNAVALHMRKAQKPFLLSVKQETQISQWKIADNLACDHLHLCSKNQQWKDGQQPCYFIAAEQQLLMELYGGLWTRHVKKQILVKLWRC